ncbi:phosphatidylserine/phosphatidylglycerophosphate/cardiolipin synthase family protein [Acidicapsa dinghuensis]|uniref:Phosphatidylserine/phosphatidylglycerophosphate/ cardiolipin synthase family protein n=1 Tax=Acidicapsa dinghuensis TaxID=2218256 RepID=A0ABW1EFC6_9BACT|nr:phospholipase D-like domain-containing protein [Acidicapsa dinghuensis]
MTALLLSIVISTGWAIVGGLCLLFVLLFLLAGVIGPVPQYSISCPDDLPANGSDGFLNVLESLVDARINRTGTLDVLTNGPSFYTAALDAMRSAQQSICLEAYVFQPSEIARLYIETMAERARAGVQVNLVLDAFGSWKTNTAFLKQLIDAGGRIERYNKIRWYNVSRVDNRTHRELLIVDGRIGFIGGAGVADQWWKGVGKSPRWRDTLVRVEGEAVTNLLATFAENWLTSHGELLCGPRYFPEIRCDNKIVAMIINSTPTPGGSTRARVLFQMLLASAQRTISITTPYFLPDKGLVQELCRAIERGVRLRILVPGRKSDHALTRSTSRGGYGPFLRAGAEVFEYRPSMIHAKILVVDGSWAVVGSTNFDNRSFGINDEVNMAVRDVDFAARLDRDMDHDLTESRRVSLADWEHRPLTERATELLGWIIERQQ